MATLDDILGPAPKAGKVPSLDDILGPAPQPYRSFGGDMPMTGPEMDAYASGDTGMGRILDAFGEGAKQGWGAGRLGLSPETEQYLTEHGVLNDYAKGEANLIKTINGAIVRPTAATLDAFLRGTTALFTGAQGLVAEVGREAGAPRLGRELAAIPEAFMGSPHPMGVPSVDLARARDLKVIGEGEAGWKGTANERAAFEEARQRFAPSQDNIVSREATKAAEPQIAEPAAAAQPPDIHTAARQIAPETFREYDDLATRKDTFRRWLDDLAETRDRNATADLDRQLAEQQAKLEGATGKRAATYQDRIDDLTEQRDKAIEDARAKGDTPDMARVRADLQEADYRMRDLAPDVTRAYGQAREMMPPDLAAQVQPQPAEAAPASVHALPEGETRVGAGATPEEAAKAVEQPGAVTPAPQEAVAQAVPSPAEAPKAAPAVDIAADVAGKLTAAGRPAEEAQAVAQIVASHYEARAARLGTTAHDLYAKEAPAIEAAPRGRKGEMGRTILKDGRAAIRLMANADASTFIHETGHQWLDEMTRDAADPKATPEAVKDAKTVRDWLGAEEGKDIARAQHEKFARGFERYLMEGRAPTQALADIFAKFKAWLTQIYETVSRLRAPITDDIRDVFDRLITANPERGTVVAPEREGESIVDRHVRLADETPPARAEPVADQVRDEADQELETKAPEVKDEISGGGKGQAGGNPPAGEGSDGNRPPGQPVAGTTGGGAGRGTIGARGNEAAAESLGARASAAAAVAERTRTAPPAGPNDTFAPAASRLVDKAGNIRLDNLNTPEDVNAVIREAAEQNNDFLGARRGVISDAQVLDLADALGMDAAQLDRRRLGEAFNAEQIIAARKLLVQSAFNVRDLAVKAAEGTDHDVMAYAEAADRHVMIQAHIAGITAEAGRALRAFRAIEGSKQATAIGDVIRSVTGRTLFQLRRAAAKVAELDTTAKVSKFERDAARKGLFDWIQSVFVNALISGPFTHAGYTAAGQMYGLFRAVGETGASAMVGKLREIAGLGEKDYAHLGEMPHQLYGMYMGARNGMKAAWQAVKSNQVVLPKEVEELKARQLALPKNQRVAGLHVAGETVTPRETIPNPEIGGVRLPVGTILEAPGRMVAALHSFNWTTFYSQSIAGQAFRQAMKEGLEGDAFSARVAQLTQSPSDAMIQAGIADANSGALMQRPNYDSFMGRVSQLTNIGVKVPDVPLPGGKSFPMGTLRPLKYIDPFVQIQGNIQRVAFMRGTPLALFSKSVRDDLMMRNGGVAFDRTAGKLIVGTSFMIAAGGLAAEGLLNPSGPSDPKQARQWQRIHGQPHGLTVGDMSYNVLRMGNLGLQMSVAADLYHTWDQIGKDDADKIAADLVHAFSQNIIDESSMRGPSQLMRAVDEHDRYGAAWVRNFASSMVPFSVGLAQVSHEIDPYSRQARTTMDAIKAKLPFVSETLFPRRDVWGEPMPSQGWAVTYRQPIIGDHTDDVLYNLGVYPTVAPRRIRGVELTDQQYDDFARISGRLAKTHLDQTVRQPGFSSLPVGVQIEMIHKNITSAREQAASVVMMKSTGTPNDIVAQATKAKVDKLTGTK